MLEEVKVPWINILLNPNIFDVDSLEKRPTPKFCSHGTSSISKEEKQDDKLHTVYEYLIS